MGLFSGGLIYLFIYLFFFWGGGGGGTYCRNFTVVKIRPDLTWPSPCPIPLLHENISVIGSILTQLLFIDEKVDLIPLIPYLYSL